MTHRMHKSGTYPTGAELWVCNICGRQQVMQWEPFKKIVLDRGNDKVQHVGGNLDMSLEVDVWHGFLDWLTRNSPPES